MVRRQQNHHRAQPSLPARQFANYSHRGFPPDAKLPSKPQRVATGSHAAPMVALVRYANMPSSPFQPEYHRLRVGFRSHPESALYAKALVRAYGIDEDEFWQEVRGLSRIIVRLGLTHIADDTMYLNHLLTYAANGHLPGLTNAKLRALGAEIEFFPGLPGCLSLLKDLVASSHPEIRLEHYVVSNGMAEMIRGSAMADSLDGIWACEFIEAPAHPAI